LLAQHAFRGELWETAAASLRQAGAKAAARFALREAAGYFEQALVSLARVSESSETRAQRIDLYFELRNVLVPLGDIGRLLEGLREATTLADELADQRRLGWALSLLADQCRIAGDYERSVEYGARALAQAEQVGDLGLQILTRFYQGLALLALGQYWSARSCFRWVVEALTGEWH